MAPAKIKQIPLFLFRNYLQINAKGAHTGYKSCLAKIRINIFYIEQGFYLLPVLNTLIFLWAAQKLHHHLDQVRSLLIECLAELFRKILRRGYLNGRYTHFPCLGSPSQCLQGR